jgi:hypothetical protein
VRANGKLELLELALNKHRSGVVKHFRPLPQLGELEKPMKVIAFNGSPRKKWNTATLLEKALEGAASQGAETKLIHLYDLDFKGC